MGGALLVLLLGLEGCAGISGGDTGMPTPRVRRQFQESLALLHADMPVDSLLLLFRPVREPGQAGILHRARMASTDHERIIYTLGWMADSPDDLGYRDQEQIDVEFAIVTVEDQRLTLVQHLPEPARD